MRRDVTMLELVTAVTEHTRTEGEAIATIVHMGQLGRSPAVWHFFRGTYRPWERSTSGDRRPTRGGEEAVRTGEASNGVNRRSHPNSGCRCSDL